MVVEHALEFAILIQLVVIGVCLIEVVPNLDVRPERRCRQSAVETPRIASAPFPMMLIQRQLVIPGVVISQRVSDWSRLSRWLFFRGCFLG